MIEEMIDSVTAKGILIERFEFQALPYTDGKIYKKISNGVIIVCNDASLSLAESLEQYEKNNFIPVNLYLDSDEKIEALFVLFLKEPYK